MSLWDKFLVIGIVGTYLTSVWAVVYIIFFMGNTPKGT